MRIRLATRATLGVMFALAILTMGGGCPTQPPANNDQTGDAKLRPFTSATELQTYIQGQVSSQSSYVGGFGRGVVEDLASGGADGVATNGLPPAAAPGAESAAGDDSGSLSTTNIQEVGVDESDVIKSDGTNFYIARGQTLRIVRAKPADELDEIAKLDLEGSVDTLYLVGDHLIALGTKFDFSPVPGAPGRPEILIWPPYYSQSTVLISQVDISDPSEPRVTRSVELDGSLVSSRLTNGRLILVLAIVPDVEPQTGFLGLPVGVELDQVLPKMRGRDGEHVMVEWDEWLRPENPDGYYMTAVLTLDANNVEEIVSRVAVVGNAGTIYASQNALYITNANYDPANNYRETTEVHKFRFNAEGAARYVASGEVRGRLLNQFSLGEHEGFLRLATHIQPEFTGGGVAVDGGVSVGSDDTPVAPPARAQERANVASNAVFVLKEEEGELLVAGSVRDIAPDEQIYSARFMGERGFLVTFKQIDPLFVLDLSNPERPRVIGELEVPGYSDYIHPVGDNLLLGVGRSVEETDFGGVVPSRAQISLFDISDLENPTLVEQMQLGGRGSMSDVSYDAKAFTFLASSGVLAIPVQLYKDAGPDPFVYGDLDFEGVVCIQVSEGGLQELGSVEAVVNPRFGWVPWRRAAIIDDHVYALTPAGVSVAALDDFEDTHSTRLSAGPEDRLYAVDVPVDGGSAEPGGAGGREPAVDD